MNPNQTLSLTGPVKCIDSKNVTIQRGALLTLSLLKDTPDYNMTVKVDDNDTVRVIFNEDEAYVMHTFNFELDGKQVVGYVADENIVACAGFKDFDDKVLAGTFDFSFGTAAALLPSKKMIRIGFKGEELYTVRLDNIQDVTVDDQKDGVRFATVDAIHFTTDKDLINWLTNPTKNKFKSTLVQKFEQRLTVISRPTTDNVYYVSGPTESHKVSWNDNFKVLSKQPTGMQVLGPVAGDERKIVLGKLIDTDEGQAADITFKPTAANKLGYEFEASAK